MGAGVEVDVGADESGELAYAKAGLDGHHEQRMVAAWQRVNQRHQDDGITLRTAAYVEALDKVAAATRLRY